MAHNAHLSHPDSVVLQIKKKFTLYSYKKKLNPFITHLMISPVFMFHVSRGDPG